MTGVLERPGEEALSPAWLAGWTVSAIHLFVFSFVFVAVFGSLDEHAPAAFESLSASYLAAVVCSALPWAFLAGCAARVELDDCVVVAPTVPTAVVSVVSVVRALALDAAVPPSMVVSPAFAGFVLYAWDFPQLAPAMAVFVPMVFFVVSSLGLACSILLRPRRLSFRARQVLRVLEALGACYFALFLLVLAPGDITGLRHPRLIGASVGTAAPYLPLHGFMARCIEFLIEPGAQAWLVLFGCLATVTAAWFGMSIAARTWHRHVRLYGHGGVGAGSRDRGPARGEGAAFRLLVAAICLLLVSTAFRLPGNGSRTALLWGIFSCAVFCVLAGFYVLEAGKRNAAGVLLDPAVPFVSKRRVLRRMITRPLYWTWPAMLILAILCNTSGAFGPVEVFVVFIISASTVAVVVTVTTLSMITGTVFGPDRMEPALRFRGRLSPGGPVDCGGSIGLWPFTCAVTAFLFSAVVGVGGCAVDSGDSLVPAFRGAWAFLFVLSVAGCWFFGFLWPVLDALDGWRGDRPYRD